MILPASLSHIVNIFINLLAAWPSGPVLEQSVRSSDPSMCGFDPSIYVFPIIFGAVFGEKVDMVGEARP